MTEQLIDYLRSRANRLDLVMARQEQLAEELKASPGKLSAALEALSESGKVRILSRLPYLVVALLPRPWSGSNPHPVRKEQRFRDDSVRMQEEVPVSRAAAATQAEDGGAGEGEALLEEVLASLGPEAESDEFRFILAGHSPTLIRRCLARVRTTKRIRVSKAALFLHLLIKLAS
jgi:hypothetical protein